MEIARALAAYWMIGGLALGAAADEVTLAPLRDNSMYSEYPENSNGAGYLFAGRSGGGGTRRALLRFDVVSAVPPGAQIDSVSLALHVSKTPTPDALPCSLHRALADWGEAGSNAGERSGAGTAAQPGDATWSHRFYATSTWSTPGGDFVAAPSGVGTLGALGPASVESSPGLVADVQSWLEEPDANFGWVLIADESSPGTAKRIDSRESSAETRPALRVVYTPASGAPVPMPPAARVGIALALGLALLRALGRAARDAATPGRA